jgi:hypothetical protein
MQETISGNTEYTLNPPQAAGQTFKAGTPVSYNSSQYVQAWDGATLTGGQGSIIGISLEPGGNYAVAGQGYAANFGQQGPPWSNVNIGTPPNQPNAVTIPYGAPFTTGGVLTMMAVQDTLFKAQVDSSDPQTTITAGSVTAGVATFTANNAHFAGEQTVLGGFSGAAAVLNGLQVTVLASGLSGTQYEANVSSVIAGNLASTGAGYDIPGQASPGQWNVGQYYGLTIDANGSWYIDLNKNTKGTNTCILIIGMYQGDVLQTNPVLEVPNGMLVFQFVPANVNV